MVLVGLSNGMVLQPLFMYGNLSKTLKISGNSFSKDTL